MERDILYNCASQTSNNFADLHDGNKFIFLMSTENDALIKELGAFITSGFKLILLTMSSTIKVIVIILVFVIKPLNIDIVHCVCGVKESSR